MIDSVKKVVIIGANGFVGRNLVNGFRNKNAIDLHYFSRTPNPHQVAVDLLSPATWEHLVHLKPDILIDATGYGVVKHQADLTSLYAINYLEKMKFASFLFEKLPDLFWVQIGTAFEYGLEQVALVEESYCLPKAHYGISKLLFSTYLKEVVRERYCIIRPFAMFGEWEDESKLIPLLILAQKQQKPVDLSAGDQYRDYFYVGDLVSFLFDLIRFNKLNILESKVLNIGSGNPKTLRELSSIIAQYLPDFREDLWQWGAIAPREGETSKFYNASFKARELGFSTTPLETALSHTIHHYVNRPTA